MHDDRTKMAGLDVLSSIFFFIMGAAMAYVSYKMKIYNRSLVVSPGLFPMILGFMFMFLAVVMGSLALRRKGLKAAGQLLAGSHLAACLTSPTFFRGVIVLGLIVAYVFLFGKIHFIAATALYLFGTFAYLKAMKLPYNIMTSLVAAVVIFSVFKYVFGIPVP